MKKSTIRTKAEKVLYPIALIFSFIFWGSFVFGFAYIFTTEPVAVEPCITEDDERYYFYSPDELTQYGIPLSDCIARSDLPEHVYQEALLDSEKQSRASLVAASGGLGLILFYAFMIIFFAYFSTGLFMGYIRLNGVRLSEKQYGVFYKIYKETAEQLGLTQVPHAYIIRASGDVNAFAVKVSRKKMVVFFAELIETLVDGEKYDELRAIAAHELTHVYLNHVNYWIFLLPIHIIPLFPSMLSRARENSADRGAVLLTKNKETVIQALIKIVTGKYVAQHVDVDEYIEQPKTERGFFTWLVRITSSHPPIPHRLKNIRDMQDIQVEA